MQTEQAIWWHLKEAKYRIIDCLLVDINNEGNLAEEDRINQTFGFLALTAKEIDKAMNLIEAPRND